MGHCTARLGLIIVGIVCFIAGIIATILARAAGWFDPGTSSLPSSEWGEFSGTPKVELLDDGRKLQLLENFVYIDPRKKPWVAQKESVVDGASIPRTFWTIVGGPLEGQYRNASIVHDEACVARVEPWEDVHLMFYEACRCGGLPEKKAKVMYAAVYHFGPSWEIKAAYKQREFIGPDGRRRLFKVRKNESHLVKPTKEPDAGVRERFEKYVNERNPSLDELKKIAPKAL